MILWPVNGRKPGRSKGGAKGTASACGVAMIRILGNSGEMTVSGELEREFLGAD